MKEKDKVEKRKLKKCNKKQKISVKNSKNNEYKTQTFEKKVKIGEKYVTNF